jgi:hypothetical protein
MKRRIVYTDVSMGDIEVCALGLAYACDHSVLRHTLVMVHQKKDTAIDATYQPSGGKKTYATDAERVA